MNVDDEYSMKYKKIQEQKIKYMMNKNFLNKMKIKNYGVFNYNIPNFKKNILDYYKWFFYYLLTKTGFNLQSAQILEAIGASIIKIKKTNILDHKMQLIKYELSQFKNNITNYSDNNCVINYIWNKIRYADRFKRFSTLDILKENINNYTNGVGISTNEILNWIKTENLKISIHAFDANYNKFCKLITPRSSVQLIFICKDNHIYPITEIEDCNKAIKTNNLMKNMLEINFDDTNKQIIMAENFNDIILKNRKRYDYNYTR